MNNNDARQYFQDKGLTYKVLSEYNIDLLKLMIQEEIMKARKDDSDCILIRVNNKTRGKKKVCLVEWIEITVKGTYFESREAVTFNRDGFIGFAGWASDTNVKPFIDAFVRWCDEVVK